MTQRFAPEDFVRALSEGNLANWIEKIGMVKAVEGEQTAIMFSEGTTCESWTKIPIAMIHSIEYETMIECRDHQHPLVRLKLNAPEDSNVTASVFASLLRSTPSAKPKHKSVIDRSGLDVRAISEVPPIPRSIARNLSQDYGIDEVIGFVQCAVVINQILSDYERCIDRGGNEQGCARIAARNIAQLACRSYCNCE